MSAKSNKVTIKIGDIVVSISSEIQVITNKIRSYQDFLTNEEPAFFLTVKERKKKNKINKKKDVVYDHINRAFYLTRKNLMLEYKGRKGVIYLKKSSNTYREFIHAFQILFGYYVIKKKKGLLIHASAVADKNHSIIFCGPSGSGKTFLAKYFEKRKYFRLMTDECVFCHLKNNKVYCSSTIFVGKEGTKPNNLRYPVGKLYFLESANVNKILSIDKSNSFTKFLANTFFSYSIIKKSFFEDKLFIKNYLRIISQINSNLNSSKFMINCNQKKNYAFLFHSRN